MSKNKTYTIPFLMFNCLLIRAADDQPHQVSWQYPILSGLYNSDKSKLLGDLEHKRALLYDIKKERYDYNKTFFGVSSVHYNHAQDKLFLVHQAEPSYTRQISLHDLHADKETALCSDDLVNQVQSYDASDNQLLLQKWYGVTLYDQRSGTKNNICVLEKNEGESLLNCDEIRGICIDADEGKIVIMSKRKIMEYDQRKGKCTELLQQPPSCFEYFRSVAYNKIKDYLLVTTNHRVFLYSLITAQKYTMTTIGLPFCGSEYGCTLLSACLDNDAKELLYVTDKKVFACNADQRVGYLAILFKSDCWNGSAFYNKDNSSVLIKTCHEAALVKKIKNRGAYCDEVPYTFNKAISLYKAQTRDKSCRCSGEQIGSMSFSADEKKIFIPTSEKMLTIPNPL